MNLPQITSSRDERPGRCGDEPGRPQRYRAKTGQALPHLDETSTPGQGTGEEILKMRP